MSITRGPMVPSITGSSKVAPVWLSVIVTLTRGTAVSFASPLPAGLARTGPDREFSLAFAVAALAMDQSFWWLARLS